MLPLIALSALLQTVSSGSPPSCSSSGALSCSSSSSRGNLSAGANSCCVNTPGGQLVQTQFWDTAPSTGPSDSWTIHGLWPDHCDGTYDSTCDSSRAYTDLGSILQQFGKDDTLNYMNQYWVDINGNDESFWEHEWSKHGTCISTIDPSCYTDYETGEEAADFFEATVNLFKTLPTYQWLSDAGIVPDSSQTYTLDDIQNAIATGFGQPATVNCKNGALDEIWYSFNVIGSVVGGQFVPVAPSGTKSTCPKTGIKYKPKN